MHYSLLAQHPDPLRVKTPRSSTERLEQTSNGLSEAIRDSQPATSSPNFLSTKRTNTKQVRLDTFEGTPNAYANSHMSTVETQIDVAAPLNEQDDKEYSILRFSKEAVPPAIHAETNISSQETIQAHVTAMKRQLDDFDTLFETDSGV